MELQVSGWVGFSDRGNDSCDLRTVIKEVYSVPTRRQRVIIVSFTVVLNLQALLLSSMF